MSVVDEIESAFMAVAEGYGVLGGWYADDRSRHEDDTERKRVFVAGNS